MTKYYLNDEHLKEIASKLGVSFEKLQTTTQECVISRRERNAPKKQYCAAILEDVGGTKPRTDSYTGKLVPRKNHRRCSQWAVKGNEYCNAHLELNSVDEIIYDSEPEPEPEPKPKPKHGMFPESKPSSSKNRTSGRLIRTGMERRGSH